MKKRIFFYVILMHYAAMAYTADARSGDLSTDYLVGSWALESQQQCNAADKEFFIFRANGTFENGRSGKAEAVGFWRIDNDIVQLQMLTSPSFFADVHEAMKGFEGSFVYEPARLVATGVLADQFYGVGVLGQQIKQAAFFRCK